MLIPSCFFLILKENKAVVRLAIQLHAWNGFDSCSSVLLFISESKGPIGLLLDPIQYGYSHLIKQVRQVALRDETFIVKSEFSL